MTTRRFSFTDSDGTVHNFTIDDFELYVKPAFGTVQCSCGKQHTIILTISPVSNQKIHGVLLGQRDNPDERIKPRTPLMYYYPFDDNSPQDLLHHGGGSL